MNESHCKKIWASGGVAYVLTLHLVDPRISEMAAGLDWDCLWIDLEHSAKTERELETMCRAVRAGGGTTQTSGQSDKAAFTPDVMARPANGEFMRMGRLLEAGAHGILYPRCESADEAREVVRWAKFPPIGERGFDGGNPDNLYSNCPPDQYLEHARENTWLAVQIESPRALSQIQSIASVEGVDMLFFGPGDYSSLIGKPGQFLDEDVLSAMGQVAEAAKAHNLIFGTPGTNAQLRQAALDAGCQFLTAGADQGLLKSAMQSRSQTMRSEA